MLSLSTDDILDATNNSIVSNEVETVPSKNFQLISNIDSKEFDYLIWRIIQSNECVDMDYSDYIIKRYQHYFKERTLPKGKILFHADP